MNRYLIDFDIKLSDESKKLLEKDLQNLINNYWYNFKSFKLSNKSLYLDCDEIIYTYVHNILNLLKIKGVKVQ